jgi:hypothetical protein
MKPEGRIKPRSHRRNVPRRTVVATDGTRPVAGRVGSPREGWNELPILFQSALIPFAGDPERAAMMMRNQNTKLRNSSAPSFLGSIALALTADPAVLLDRWRSRLDPVAGRSIEGLGDDFQLATMLGLVRRFEFTGPPARGRRREAIQRQSAVSPP